MGEKNLQHLLFESADEAKYLQMNDTEHYTELADYSMQQDRAQAILADRLDFAYVRKIRQCTTIRLMIAKLDQEFRTTTDIGIITKRNAYLSMKFNEGGDLKRYVDIHENWAQAYEEAGGEILEKDRVMNLHSSLPEKYDHILNYYRLSPDAKTYDTYRKYLLEAYERQGTKDQKLKKEQKVYSATDQKNSPTNGKTANRLKNCYECGEIGHVNRDCPKRKQIRKNDLQTDTNPSSTKPTYRNSYTDQKKGAKSEETQASTNKDAKTDWTKFKNFTDKPKSMNVTLSERAKKLLLNSTRKNPKIKQNRL